ncbi:hypothetical protein [Reyranella sp. CPCC 100927]|uniref:IS1096 element passenger TnpR family protein n=1 Tax=Reyranella sp. CPCC 100927 TaxID=2599616 RepID=UPI0015B56D3E|nr:hypothetical protein [Reyranella sp. CPCC 100927]
MTTGIRTFRVALHQKPTVYRIIEIESASSLHDLAEAAMTSFDFDFEHPFGFYSSDKPDTMRRQQPMYELAADTGEKTEAGSVQNTKVADAFAKQGHVMVLLYDYNAKWLFHVEMTGTGQKAAGKRYPRMAGSKGDAPDQYPDDFDI